MRNRTTRGLRILLGAICVICPGLPSARAEPAPCTFPGQHEMLNVQLFMGLDMPGNETVTAKAWESFLGSVVTPRFPDGFTVYNAYGQWWNPQTRSIDKENSKVINIVVADSPPARSEIADISAAYRKRFRQISVGIVSSQACAAF